MTMVKKMERGSTPRLRSVTHGEPFPGGTRAKYCGPAAISAISGQTAEVANAWINYHRGRPLHYQSQGAHTSEIREALRSLGWSIQLIPLVATIKAEYVDQHRADLRAGNHPTLAKWLRQRKGTDRANVFLVSISESRPHWIVVQGQKTCDSWCNEMQHVKDSPHRRKKVWRVHLVVPFGTNEETQALRRKRTPILPPKDYTPIYVKDREWGYVVADHERHKDRKVSASWSNLFRF